MHFISTKSSKGFTLIELLVVIAIIGLLSSIVFAALSTAREKARDARRMSEIREIAKAIELYHLANGSYPQSTGWCTQISNTANGWGAAFQADIAPFMAQVPLDPRHARTYQDYFYYNTNDLNSFALYAELERTDRTDDGFTGCARIGDINNEYDFRYPPF